MYTKEYRDRTVPDKLTGDDKDLHSVDRSMILVIAHGDRFAPKYCKLLCELCRDACKPNTVECTEAVSIVLEGLVACIEDTLGAPYPLVIERWLRKEFNRMVNANSTKEDSKGKATDRAIVQEEHIQTKDLKTFIQNRLQLKITSTTIANLITDGEDMNYDDLSKLYHSLIRQPLV